MGFLVKPKDSAESVQVKFSIPKVLEDQAKEMAQDAGLGEDTNEVYRQAIDYAFKAAKRKKKAPAEGVEKKPKKGGKAEAEGVEKKPKAEAEG